ncbi:MAG: ammonium transporter [Armatimonadota bacterium]|nr:ammonium transporter [Armatimonadota bacterium]
MSKFRGLYYRAGMLGAASVALVAGFRGPAAAAGGAARIDPGDTAWVLASAALVMLMTPALGLFYAGMVRRKNVLATIMHSFFLVALVGVQWMIFGYSLAFGPDRNGIIGSLDWIGLRNVSLLPNPDYAATIPHQAFMVYQAMFAVITPALISGAFAERIKFRSYVIFTVLWATLVYDPVAHWVWSPHGWLRNMGALDFAGGIVVHLTSGIAALTCAVIMGRRVGHGTEEMMPHNVTMTLLGAGLLWFGWFGFNAGSALGSGALATSAFVVTNASACTATLTWCIIEAWHRGKPTALGAASGAIAGLAAVTPGAGFVGPMAAMGIGVVASCISYCAILAKNKFRYDDSLDVFAVHGIGGIWGALAIGLFASKLINPAGNNGLLFGNPGLIGVQLKAVAIVAVYTFVVTAVLLRLVGIVSPMRVSEEDEDIGLDLTQHGEYGYHG